MVCLPPDAVLQVLVGAHAVLANGGVIAPAGVHLVALAAKRHSIPFVVLVGLHKLSPLFPHDPDVTFNGEWQHATSGGCCRYSWVPSCVLMRLAVCL
jgi:translation initiation factor eIF-2B subunit beta